MVNLFFQDSIPIFVIPKFKKMRISCFLFFMTLTTFLWGQSQQLRDSLPYSEIKTVFQHLQQYEKMLIKTDLDSLRINRKYGKKQEAILYTSGKDLELIQLPIKITARGKFRRKTCDLPPIWIDFPEKVLTEWGMYPKYDKLKLVTHCLLKTENKEALMKEFWTYKMHNQLTEHSFKVHLMEIIYVHAKDSKRKIKNYAFLIENTREMAHRIDGEIIAGMGKQVSQMTEESYNNTLIFNYMIGNTDWNVELEKNLKFVQRRGMEKMTIVPYDFDFTALANPPYLKFLKEQNKDPHPKNRIAKGKCENYEGLMKTATQFATLRNTGFNCYKDCPILSNNEKKAMQFYLQDFFRLLKNEKKLKAVFLEEKS
jgi:hypothetical protein